MVSYRYSYYYYTHMRISTTSALKDTNMDRTEYSMSILCMLFIHFIHFIHLIHSLQVWY